MKTQKDGRLMASGSVDGNVNVWEVPGGRRVATLQGHTAAVYGVALSADGRFVASGADDGTVRLWEVETGQLLATHAHAGGVRANYVPKEGGNAFRGVVFGAYAPGGL